MRSKPCRQLAVVLLCVGAAPAGVLAQPKHKAESTEVSDKTMDKQMAWENKVMGEDRAKQADMKKIAAAQKLAEEARKHPVPEPAPKVKDPSKEGVRAKQEAAIGLPIASDEEANRHHSGKTPSAKRASQPSASANDELGALVASSLASEKASNGQSDRATSKSAGSKSKAKRSTKSAPSALDKIFSDEP